MQIYSLDKYIPVHLSLFLTASEEAKHSHLFVSNIVLESERSSLIVDMNLLSEMIVNLSRAQ